MHGILSEDSGLVQWSNVSPHHWGRSVSIFILGLAYDLDALTSQAKIGVLIGSILSAVTGFAFLRAVSSKDDQPIQEVSVDDPDRGSRY